MNIVWTVVLIVGIGILLFVSPQTILSDMLSASEKSVKLCISLLAIYAFWLGILKIVDKTGLSKKIAKLLSPFIDLLFGKGLDEYTKNQIAINLSSNILGLGNASTPSAIRAMKGLDRGSEKISDQMTMLVILNCLSLQLLPTTIIGLRISSGSQNASSIILPTILTSFLTATIVLALLKTIFGVKKIKNGK